MTAGGSEAAQTYEKAQDGTLYWTLSLYISPERVAAAAGRPGQRLDHRLFERVQRVHMPSQALRDAIDPLFNDIADREVLGEVQEMLLAATGAEGEDAKAAGKAIRTPEALTFHPPAEIAWTTEGVTYRASPEGLGDARAVRFRRFWFAHNNGALSYHMSFSHHYAAHTGKGGGYGPATYYFLSLLQKLAAPKEFTLKAEIREAGDTVSALDPDLGSEPNAAPEEADACGTIAPLDRLEVADASGKRQRFWPFVEDRLTADAEQLFERLAAAMEHGTAPEKAAHTPLRWQDLIEEVPFIEVPGLTIPKSRFMFLFHDGRFFKRLMPLDPVSGETAARKTMVQEPCYAPYQQELEKRVAKAEAGDGTVELDADYWNWATTRPNYDEWIKGRRPVLRKPGGGNFRSAAELAAAMRGGAVELTVGEDGAPLAEPQTLHIPAFEPQRTDCLDYLFLAGFNQNIIDFMNQDTSEILDSIDPIYPDSDEQSDERFFVRYANHRAMITYVPKSRSLETGNDYIGTCPYAFLIHAMSLHNEYLAREHEAKSMARIERIEWLVTPEKERADVPLSAAARALDESEPLRGEDDYDRTELAINQAKLAEYRDYERFRYANPFRYDTERDVFAKLEELRGITRKKEALALAIASLEDHASDLQRRHEQQTDRAAARRETQLSILLGGTGIFGAGQMMYWIGD
ncbi:MAG TPA: hypothetical protein PKD99_17680, partial [Sphingopyxis sp.]|nr:hypothetical protein [Sphingopyxis sp.]